MEAEGTSYCVERAPLVLLSLVGLAESCKKETWGREEEVGRHAEGKTYGSLIVYHFLKLLSVLFLSS